MSLKFQVIKICSKRQFHLAIVALFEPQHHFKSRLNWLDKHCNLDPVKFDYGEKFATSFRCASVTILKCLPLILTFNFGPLSTLHYIYSAREKVQGVILHHV